MTKTLRSIALTTVISSTWLWIGMAMVPVACTTSEPDATAPQRDEVPSAPTQTVDNQPLPEELEGINPVWFGDFDAMVERRIIRAVVAYSLTNYFLDGAEQKGISYEALKLFEEDINERLGTGHLKVHVVITPVSRDRLIPALVEGRADIAAANLTMTPERMKLVDFSVPAATDVSEVVVTGPSALRVESLDDLSGREILVRTSSSYYESLRLLNELFEKRGMAPIELTPAQEHLEDEDLLEMVNAGLVPTIVVDSHKADFWAQVFPNITVHSDIAVATGGRIGWAFRKDSPKLSGVVNAFIEKHKKGTLMGNIILKKYLQSTKWVERSLSPDATERFRKTIELFKRYASQYDFDWLMVAALAYQESGLDQSRRSAAGAVGVMQLLPSTAADPNVGIPNIEILENNIHAGTKYLRFLRDRYFSGEEMDDLNQTLFSFAAYNAGPARVRGLRQRAGNMRLNPNVWFRNVEVVAAKEIGRETVQYVSNIFKYYVAYARIVDELQRKGRLAS